MIILVRHGESSANNFFHGSEDEEGGTHRSRAAFRDKLAGANRMSSLFDVPLTELGEFQAKETAQYLAAYCKSCDFKPEVWVSPLKRARDTAQPFLEYGLHSGEKKVVAGLQEFTKPTKKAPKPFIVDEDISAFFARVHEFVDAFFVNAKPPQNLIIFGHSLFFSAMISYLGTQAKARFDDKNIAFHLPNCSITAFNRVRPHEYEIYLTSFIGHLSKPSGQHTLLGRKLAVSETQCARSDKKTTKDE